MTPTRSSRPRFCSACHSTIDANAEHYQSAGGCFYHPSCRLLPNEVDRRGGLYRGKAVDDYYRALVQFQR